jgi:hypothetical protein
MPRGKQPAIPDELLDQLLSGSDPRAALAEGGLLDGLKKALAERALDAELDHHGRNGPGGRFAARPARRRGAEASAGRPGCRRKVALRPVPEQESGWRCPFGWHRLPRPPAGRKKATPASRAPPSLGRKRPSTQQRG